ncbi:hypothetical protein [Flavobacterium sp. CSZ]|uniref:hypothetical protein n=1 Tax=Flavobacterium sp. CSZ TaxID=2783791 RepID=UPI00188C0086|nr:hypothetical protein [Flavobacterium sp. CSZ]MBF4486690.1 hypothetical protein [Flavobacterium sp. CSZ]
MSAYTICPKFIEFAKQNKKYINDVLMVFVPDNSKTICIDKEEDILKEYGQIIQSDKDLTDWYKFLCMTKDSNFTKVDIKKPITSLPIQICEKSFEKLLITNCNSNYSLLKSEIQDKGISLLDKDLAKVKLNYGNEAFPKTTKSSFTTVTPQNVFDVVNEICFQFKDVIENKGLFKLIVNKDGIRVSESKAQLLFFGVAYSHCAANDLKLSPEVDSGNGPVDFNISKGFKANVNVEMKFADNPKLEKGLWSQLDIYNKAENTEKSIYLIIKTNNVYDKKISKLTSILQYRKNRGMILPDIYIIDSSYKASASVRP